MSQGSVEGMKINHVIVDFLLPALAVVTEKLLICFLPAVSSHLL